MANFAEKMTNQNNPIPGRPFLAAVLRLAGLWVYFIAVWEVLRLLFVGLYSGMIGGRTSDYAAAMSHGLAMDACVAGYLTAVPGFLLAAAMFVGNRHLRTVMKVVLGVEAAVCGLVAVADMALYSHWGFRLDSTPLFYLTSSPRLAFASATAAELIGGVAAVCVLSAAIWYGACRIAAWQPRQLPRRRAASAAAMTLFTALLFVPIRGGFTVSTMNPSRAYFSVNQRLNHAAINPAFNLLYSATHADNYSGTYRFYTDAEASRLAAALEAGAVCGDSLRLNWLGETRPDIYLIIMESFSAHLLPSLGGEPIAVRLDSLAAGGLSFTSIYASGFRTDRALPAILNGVPAQPSGSLLKYVDKIEALPAIASTLADSAGYSTAYYYGGDVNFTNMKALLVSSGYDGIVCDHDFPLLQRTGKWGVHDGDVFDRAYADASAAEASHPRFVTIQTSSSHEPFEVPARVGGHTDDRLNAFAYADSCMEAFVRRVMALPSSRSRLFVIVPDHYGVYPENLDDMSARHHVPLVFYGDAVALPATTVNTVGTQSDIAATLLGAMGIDASAFLYSHDLAAEAPGAYAYFCEPGQAGMLTASDTVYISVDADAVNYRGGAGADSLAVEAKAYLQVLYNRLSEL